MGVFQWVASDGSRLRPSSQTTSAPPGLTRSSLTYVDGHFVCLGEDGALRLIKVNPKQYEETARAVLKGADGEPLLKYPAWAAPIISHGLMYVRGKDRLVCLDLIPAK